MQVYLALSGELTAFEKTFLLSISKQLYKLSPKQIALAQKILGKYFSRDNFIHDVTRCRAARKSAGAGNTSRDFHANEDKELRELIKNTDGKPV